jgi:protein O-mannosyl-transferase
MPMVSPDSFLAEQGRNPSEGTTSGRFSLTGAAICALLFISSCIAYLPATKLGFIDFDDPAYVAKNPHVIDGFTWHSLYWAFTSFDPDNWFPLTRLSHMLDYTLFGQAAQWHHAVNILIHALASVMLYAFLRRAARQRWLALFVAAVFALHPLHVESVAWISERKDVLCAFFWFATLWMWIAYREKPSAAKYAAALALFAAGLMSKPMIVTLPLLLPLLELWPLRQPFSRRQVLRMLPFLSLSLVAGILTVLAQRASGAMASIIAVSGGTRIGNALITPFIYIEKTFWPADLSVLYPWPVVQSVWLALLAAVSIAAISGLTLRLRHTRPYLTTGWFWFLITLLPVLGILQAGPQARADRYMYVPMVGLLIMVAWGAADSMKTIRPHRRWTAAAIFAGAGAVCLWLATITWTQEQYWESAGKLFRHAITADEKNYLAWEFLGSTMDMDGELDERIECYRTAVQLRPDFPDLRANLGGILLQAEQVSESIAQLERALEIQPGDTRTRCILGAAFLRANRADEAVSEFRRAVRDDPQSAMVRNDLAVGLWRLRENDNGNGKAEARKQLEKAIALRPDYSLPHSNLGLVLLETPGAHEEAASEFVQALGIYPDDATAHIGLYRALSQADPVAAQTHLNSAHLLVPDPESFRRFETLRLDYGEHR